MSYVSVFKNIPDFLSQPTGIAAIASIGIHGAIAFILPLMPVESNKPKTVGTSKAVGLVELSQAEQQRLPKTAVAPKVALQPQIPLPNINSTLPNQPPLPPIPSNPSILQPLPQSTSVYPTYSLPKRQSFRLSPSTRFNTGRSAYKPYTSAYKPYTSAYKPYTSRKTAVNYRNSRKLPIVDPAKSIPGVNTNQNPPSNQSQKRVTNNAGNQQLVARVQQVFQSGDNYSIAATGKFQEYQPKSPASTTQSPSPSPSSNQAIAALNSYQALRQSVQQKYPGVEEKRVIRRVIPTENVALQGKVTGTLVVDAERKVVDVVFPSNSSISPAQKVAIRKYFLKNPPPGSKNLASYPFSLSFQKNESNVAVDNQIKPGATPAKNQSLEQKLQNTKKQQAATSNQPVKLKNPVQISPPTNTNSGKQQESTSNQPVKLKNPVQVSPSPNSSKQQATSANQPVKLKNPVQVSPSSNSSQKLIDRLRQVKKERQN
ncbi:hypothetical protein [Calothrix rhizosoleniae]|uniref:hypothetical protein n=1 Tax=Calothrix rhizosoleniae TaxID=888997 RepID=UPI000B49C90E|nr:hypothetical protein [Calothrix rhizosoleniae]